jgi:predicted Holliday junction resolvase-like endonuclease
MIYEIIVTLTFFLIVLLGFLVPLTFDIVFDNKQLERTKEHIEHQTSLSDTIVKMKKAKKSAQDNYDRLPEEEKLKLKESHARAMQKLDSTIGESEAALIGSAMASLAMMKRS